MKRILPLVFLSYLLVNCSTDSSSPDPEVDDTPGGDTHDISDLNSLEGLALDNLVLPPGFEINVFARVDKARQMVLSPNGTLFVSNKDGNRVYAVRDVDGDWQADERYVIASGLITPNGVAFKDGDLFVAEVPKLRKYEDIEADLSNPPTPTIIYNDYPSEGHHGWKYIAFGPDGKLYVPVGAPCDTCESDDEIYASITRMDPDGSNREIVAHGVRNTVGITWHPITQELWFTENGRDWLGDASPPDELNKVSVNGEHFGYPYCHSGIADPDFGSIRPCSDFVAPVQQLGPHVAALGLKFYTGSSFPSEYTHRIFIAEHGSWNRTNSAGHTGHKVTMVTEENGVGIAYEDFLTGFLNETTNVAWGRPVDIVLAPDGSILLSDDLSGTIYRISYEG